MTLKTPAMITKVRPVWQRELMVNGNGHTAKPFTEAQAVLVGRRGRLGNLKSEAREWCSRCLVSVKVVDTRGVIHWVDQEDAS